MDLLKTKIYLDKLNREFARVNKDPENIVRLDVDIIATYVRELYDAVLSDESVPVPPRPEPVPTRRPAAPRPPQVDEVAPRPSMPAAPPPPPQEQPEREVPHNPPPTAQPSPAFVEEKPTPAATSEPEVVVASKNQIHYVSSPEAEALFEEKKAKELSEKLSELPIADLKKAIALNDRLLLTRELFAGDGQSFEATLNALNGFTQFSEAKVYLLENCVIRYGWLDKKRVEIVKNFIKLVRRRYK